MAESSDLLPLSQPPNPGLVGYVAAYVLPQADLGAEPLVVGGAIVADLVLVPGAGWRRLPYTQGTLKFDETPKPDRGGTTYQVRVVAQRPQPTPAILAALELLDRRRLLLLLVEATGGRRLLGNREEYVLLTTTGEGQNPSSKAGVELRLEGSATHRAPYYVGGAPLLSGGAVPQPAGGGGYVQIFDNLGKLRAIVPAGTKVTVTSPFAFDLTY